ncbi:MAG: type II toxin-antitoxin system RelE/ParE family toxin [Acidobacteriota bacterium]
MKVVWSQLAIDRAAEEAALIARDKPGAALRWIEALFAAVDRLETFPESGPVVPEIGLSNYRQLRSGAHRVVYRLDPKAVHILTVRRFKQLLRLSEIE